MKRVIVEITGGVADVIADEGVEVLIVDWDDARASGMENLVVDMDMKGDNGEVDQELKIILEEIDNWTQGEL